MNGAWSLSRARRCRIEPFVNFGRRTETDAALDHRLPNAAAEFMNTRVRLIARSRRTALPPECTALVTEFLTTGPAPTWMPIHRAARR